MSEQNRQIPELFQDYPTLNSHKNKQNQQNNHIYSLTDFKHIPPKDTIPKIMEFKHYLMDKGQVLLKRKKIDREENSRIHKSIKKYYCDEEGDVIRFNQYKEKDLKLGIFDVEANFEEKEPEADFDSSELVKKTGFYMALKELKSGVEEIRKNGMLEVRNFSKYLRKNKDVNLFEAFENL